MVDKTLKSEVQEMSDIERITWHYVMDIHDSKNYWYSITRSVN